MKESVIWILAVGVFGILNTEMGIIGVLPEVAQRYDVSPMAASALVSLFALAIAVSGPILPMLMSRFRRKRVMVSVLALFAVCNVAAAFAPSFEMMLAARVLPAFFHPVFVSFALAMASDCVSRQSDAPKAVAKIMVGVSAGMVLGAPVAGLLAEAFSLEASLLCFAAVNIAALIATVACVPASEKRVRVSYGDQLRVLKRKRLWLALVGVVALNGSIFGVYSYATSYLGDAMGFSAQAISAVLFVYGLFNIAGNMAAGKGLSSTPLRFMALQPLVIGGVYALMLAANTAPALVVVAVLAWGVAAGAVSNTIQHWVASAAPGAPEFANGLFLTAANLGISFATPLCGVFVAHAGVQTVPWGGIALAAVSAAFIVAQICVSKTLARRSVRRNLGRAL